MSGTRVAVDRVGDAVREIRIVPDAAGREAIALRLRIPAVTALDCVFRLRAGRADEVLADGVLQAWVIQDDVSTGEPFEAPIEERFRLIFMPKDALADMTDPDDPVDEVGYDGNTIDLHDTMCEQLALALDPYPRAG